MPEYLTVKLATEDPSCINEYSIELLEGNKDIKILTDILKGGKGPRGYLAACILVQNWTSTYSVSKSIEEGRLSDIDNAIEDLYRRKQDLVTNPVFQSDGLDVALAPPYTVVRLESIVEAAKARIEEISAIDEKVNDWLRERSKLEVRVKLTKKLHESLILLARRELPLSIPPPPADPFAVTEKLDTEETSA